MLDQLRPLLSEDPHLALQHAALQASLDEAQRLNDRIGELTAERMQAVRLCKEAMAAGVEARVRLAGLLVGRLGSRNEELIAFGLHPRPRTLRRRARSEPEPRDPTDPGQQT